MDKAHQCMYCQLGLHSCRVKCAKCSDCTLCVECFACGVEAGCHFKEHSYQILDDSRVTVFASRSRAWTATEEEVMLESIELYSIGNWVDIADRVKTKSREECLAHYQTYYISGNVGRGTFKSGSTAVKKLTDHSLTEKGPPPSTVIPPSELTIQEQQELGYMPLRDDFDKEYNNDAEVSISALTIAPDDEDVEKAFTLHNLRLYRDQLKERELRKRIAKDYSVIQSATTAGTKKSLASRKKQSKDEREVREKMKIVARFQRFSEHEAMFSSLLKEKKLKSEIKEMIKLRKNGITQLKEGPVFESERLRRERNKEMKKKVGSLTPLKTPTRERDEDRGSHISRSGEDPSQAMDDGSTKSSNTTNGFTAGSLSKGEEILCNNEKKLCERMKMKPATYITLKTYIIKDHLQRAHGIPVKSRSISQLDRRHRQMIVNYLYTNGWISNNINH